MLLSKCWFKYCIRYGVLIAVRAVPSTGSLWYYTQKELQTENSHSTIDTSTAQLSRYQATIQVELQIQDLLFH